MNKIQYRIVDNKIEELHTVVVHRFKMGETSDPEIAIAVPILEWQKTDPGKFVMQYCVEKPSFHYYLQQYDLRYQCCIIATLEMKRLSEFYLKFDKP